MQALGSEFPHSVTVLCPNEDPSHCLAAAWGLGACGEDWVWCWIDLDHVQISFRNEEDGSEFLSRAGGHAHRVQAQQRPHA